MSTQRTENMPCIICNKSNLATNSVKSAFQQNINDDVTTRKKFFRRLERYLDDVSNHAGPDVGEIEGISFLSDKRFPNASIFCCADCVKIMESFCQLYEQLEYIKLELNWRVRTLSNLLSAAQNDEQSKTGRIQDHGNLLETETFGLDKTIEMITGFRSDLIKKCERKLKESFPRLTLKKCAPPTSHLKLTRTDTDDAIPDEVKSEPLLMQPESPEVDKMSSRLGSPSRYPKYPPETFSSFDNALEDDEQFRDMDSDVSSEDDDNYEPEESSNMKFEEDVDSDNDTSCEDSDNRNDQVISNSKIHLSGAKQTKASNVEHTGPEIHSDFHIKTESADSSDDEDYYEAINDAIENSENDNEERSSSPSSQTDPAENPLEYHDTQLPQLVAISSSPSTSKKLRFQCPLCFKEFATRNTYTRHHRDVHLQIKPFKCPTCEHSFARSHHLAKHLKNLRCNQRPKESDDENCSNDISDKNHSMQTLTRKPTATKMKVEKEATTQMEVDDGIQLSQKHSPDNEPSSESEHKVNMPKSILNIKTGKHQCSLCQMEFSQSSSYHRHYRDVHSVAKPHKCDGCPLRFTRRQHLTRHRESTNCSANQDNQSVRLKYPCKICDKLFLRVEHLKRHLKDIHSQNNVEVKAAIAGLPQSSSNPSTVTVGSVMKEDARAKYPCTIIVTAEDCGKPQSSFDPATATQSCNRCPRTFKNLRQFHSHFNETHRKIRFKCSLCGKEFSRRDKYNRHHQSVHLKLLPFSCPTCSKRFIGRPELSRHITRDTCKKPNVAPEEKAHLCSVCGKVFTRSDFLYNHMRTVHLKLGRVSCDQCGKVFSSATNLRIHVKLVHLKLREYVCEQCGKTFPQAYRLKEHVKSIHSQVRDHGCEICGKMFKLRSTLMGHRREMHANKKEK